MAISYLKYAVLILKQVFTKKFRTFDPHPPTVKFKVLIIKKIKRWFPFLRLERIQKRVLFLEMFFYNYSVRPSIKKRKNSKS